MDRRGRSQVYTPGSVDSWDMENVKFLRKISHNGPVGNPTSALPPPHQDFDTVSYVSDTESAIFDEGVQLVSSDIGELSEDDDSKRVLYGSNNRYRNQNCIIEESEYGMSSSNESEMQTPTRLLDEALYSGGNGFALLNKSIVMKQMKSMAKSTLKDPYLEDEKIDDDDVESQPIEPTPIVRKQSNGNNGSVPPAGGVSSRKNSRVGVGVVGLGLDDIHHFDRRFMKMKKPKPSLVTLGFMEPQLEDCYLLDVMTIRNESVLAERSRVETNSHCRMSMSLSGMSSDNSQDSENESQGIDKILKLNGNSRRNGSAGLPSSSSSSVSSEEFNSAREGSFFPSPTDDPIEIHRDSSPDDDTRASSCSPVSVVVRGECASRFPSYPQSSERSFATASSNYYYLGQQQQDFEQFEDRSSIVSEQEMNDKESLRLVETPRSPSPYYVRLRRDLIPPSYTPPHPRQPWNFGMNRQGLLVIDYSPNWDGLESYVRSLSLQN